VVKRVVLALNKLNEQHVRSGQTGLRPMSVSSYAINASREESGVDVEVLEMWHGINRERSRADGATGSRSPDDG
jgi:hypothetical protein